ncbi:MAG: ATP-binding protein [Phycisphaeraceae bacterium]|nr:MAG: ATP-binding protein [Phycisphaeraceae bacterium]
MAKQPWKAWHEVVRLREDLRSGDLPLHMFAADLYEVMMQNGKRPIYEKPEEFFALTFPTHNLRNLVKDVVLRLAGKNDKAVRQLELTYGGGKTHTLITMRHLVHDPARLPHLPAVREFMETIGQDLPRARVAALCFDKIDVETGCEVRSPDGAVRRLKHPWSILAYQVAGDDGLKLMSAKGVAEERETPPAENTLTDLLSLPSRQGMGTLVLLDEVLLYAKVKIRSEPGWIDILTSFFQYLTQAAAKVNRCCIVASLLSSDPKDQADDLGKRIVSDLYDIFQRQREEAVQPVEKDDVAEVLRRRLFDPVSGQDRDSWRQHVIAALKGITPLDEQTGKAGASAEERYLKSYPFHPELTEVFYTKWTTIDRFQKTRGVLRTFALALREAENWDDCPLVGPAVFLNSPKQGGLSEAARELVLIADTTVTDGQATRWTGIIQSELDVAKRVQADSVGLRVREVEQAVIATFLHSQPAGRSAKTRDLMLLVGPCRPDKIELEKGLARWARSSYWLDDGDLPEKDGQLPTEWRLGNRPNLTQMQAAAAAQISDDVVKAKMLEEIGRTKALTSGASAFGVRVHTLPTKPRDIEDDGLFHYAVLPPSAASDSGKPSAEAKRFLDETTGSDKPRVYRNAVLLLAPSREGLDVAHARVRDQLAWERVLDDLTPKNDEDRKQKGSVDVARLQTLKINIDKARARVPEAIRQAYCIVVTVSEKDEAQAFKVTVTDEPHFDTIKGDSRSRVQDTAITAEALLPDGPYNLWKGGETSRRVKDLAGAFAQLPHLPKMLKAQAIVETLVEGCVQGTFVLKLTRPDRTFRTWWRSRPDEAALNDPALELVLPEAAELGEISGELLARGTLPGLWASDEITAHDVLSYFDGSKVVQVDRGGFPEPMTVPKAAEVVVNAAICEAVELGKVWLISGPASLLGEPIPAGVLTPTARLRPPPATLSAASLLPENLPAAWQDGSASALALASALSQAAGVALPWKTIRDAISGALQARFVELTDDSNDWPCDLVAAKSIRLKVAAAQVPSGGGGGGGTGRRPPPPNVCVAEADFEPSQIQDLGDAVPRLLDIKARTNVSLRFHVRLEIGDGVTAPDPKVVEDVNRALEGLGGSFKVN